MDEDEPAGTCGICGERVPTADLFEHLLVEHDIDAESELLRWPDGSPVVVDQTLEPEDFRGDG